MNNFQFILNREDFHNRRRYSIGSSDIPVILNLVKQKTPYELWKEKTGRDFSKQEQASKSSATALGHAVEGIILSREIEELTDADIAHTFRVDYYQHENERAADWNPATDFVPFTFFVYPDDKRFTGSPDCVRLSEDLIIEAKLGSRFANIRSILKPDGYDIEDSSEHGLPLRVYLQCQWQSLVSGIKNITIRALIDSVFESRHEFKANFQIQEKLIKVSDRFLWHVKNDKPPAPVNSNDVLDIYADSTNEVLVVGGEAETEPRGHRNELKRWQSVAKEAKKRIEEHKTALGICMKDKRVLQAVNGDILAKRIINKPAWSTIGVQKIYDQTPEAFKLLDKAGLIPEKESKEYIK